MRRIHATLAMAFLLVLAYRAYSACEGVEVEGHCIPFSYGSLVTPSPDAPQVAFTAGLGQPLVFHASLSDTGSSLGSGCYYTLNWAHQRPNGLWESLSEAHVDSVAIDTDYTFTWTSLELGVHKLTPYVNHNVPSIPAAYVYDSPDTIVVTVKALWHHGSLRYEGAIRVIKDDTDGPRSMCCAGGRGLAYNPNGNAGADTSVYLPGSLFISGNEGENADGGYIGEIKIPKPVNSPGQVVTDLPMAAWIQDLTDAAGSLYQNYPHGFGARRSFGDLFYVDGAIPKLFWTVRQLYNGPNSDIPSVGRVRTTLSDPHSEGLWHIGPSFNGNDRWPYHMSVTSDYMFLAPAAWANQYTGGKRLISGMGDREDGTNGACQGPGMTAWDLNVADGLTNGSELDALTIAWYQTQPVPMSECDSCSGVGIHPFPAYSPEDEWTDGAWLTHDGRQSVIIAGNKCRYCSFYSGCHCEVPGSTCPPDYDSSPKWNGGPCGAGAGWTCGQQPWATNPAKVAQILMFDPDVLGQAALGQLASWDVKPYDIIDLQPYVYEATECNPDVQAVAYAPALGRIFVTEFNKDHSQSSSATVPIIQVYRFVALPGYVVSFTVSCPSYVLAGQPTAVSVDWQLTTADGCTVVDDTDFDRVALLDGTTEIDYANGPQTPPYIFSWTPSSTGIVNLTAILENVGSCTGVVQSPIRAVSVN